MLTSPPEFTGAVTDLINAPIAILLILLTAGIKDSRKRRKLLFVLLYLSVALTGIYGFIIHAFQLSDKTTLILWIFLYPFMHMMVLIFSLISSDSNLGAKAYKRSAIILSVMTAVSCIVTELFLCFTDINALYPFIIFAVLALIPSLFIFAKKAISTKEKFSSLMTAGLIIQLIGAVFQATRNVYITLIWEFDYNSIYHVLLTVSIIVFYFAHRHCAEK